MAKGRKTGGRQRGAPKTGGRLRGTPNKLTVAKRALGPMLARAAKEHKLMDAIGTPEFERLFKELEQERRLEWEWDA